MDGQDWTPVVMRRTYTKKEATAVAALNGKSTVVARDPLKNEKVRMAKLDSDDAPPVKKRLTTESIQELIKKRIEMKLTQDKADAACALPKHTFREIEAGRLYPSEDQKRKIQQNLSVSLKTSV
jgi:hypothetical protein